MELYNIIRKVPFRGMRATYENRQQQNRFSLFYKVLQSEHFASTWIYNTIKVLE